MYRVSVFSVVATMMAGVKELKKKDGMIDHSKDWTNTGSFVNKPSKGWLHPNEQLHPDAGVSYGVRVRPILLITLAMG